MAGKRISTPAGAHGKDQLEGEAKGRHGTSDLKQTEADIVIIGMPRLKAKQVVEIRGVGKKFSGNWYLTSVKHTISPDSGYGCEGKVKRNAVGSSQPKAQKSKGKVNSKPGKNTSPQSGRTSPPRNQVVIDADSGKRLR